MAHLHDPFIGVKDYEWEGMCVDDFLVTSSRKHHFFNDPCVWSLQSFASPSYVKSREYQSGKETGLLQ